MSSQDRPKTAQKAEERAKTLPKRSQFPKKLFNVFCGSVFEEEIPQDQVNTAPRPLRTLQFRPKFTLRRPKTFPETPQDPYENCPKTVQDGPVPPQNRHKIAP